jgi:hypothetical protein
MLSEEVPSKPVATSNSSASAMGHRHFTEFGIQRG